MNEHTPVLLEEVFAALAVRPDGLYVDATFGRGGHSARILAGLGPSGRLIAIDRDPQAIAAGRLRFAGEPRLQLLQAEFADLLALVRTHATLAHCQGVLFDFGLSSPQLENAERGFSFAQDGPLDMRMDPLHGEPVSAWLERASADEIRHVIETYGEERFARRIAEEIVRGRESSGPLSRTGELATLVARCVRTRERGKHPATRTFQALRMYINDEPAQIERGLAGALELLAPAGRLAAISFHSLEDRAVKQFIRRHSQSDPRLARLPWLPPQAAPPLRTVGRKVKPTSAEIAANPRARSAVLRVAERVQP